LAAYVTEKTIARKTKEWLTAIAPLNTRSLDLAVPDSALLVIDMQRFFTRPEGAAYMHACDAIIENIRRLIDAFRKAKRPVIYTTHVHHPDGLDAGMIGWWAEMCKEGTPDSEVDCRIAPLPNEKVIRKHRYRAFFDTDLETILRCQKIKDLVITGVMTNMCCETTAREAFMRDYRVFFTADATGTVTEEMHLASLMNLALGFAFVTRTGEILSQISQI
jgi:nicotinamidase-related amidase